MQQVLQDVRYAVRAMFNERSFSAMAILLLALGIGSTTAMFSVVRAVLLEPLAYQDPDRLVQLSMANSRNLATMTSARFDFLKANGRFFTDIGAFGLPQDMMLSTSAETEQLSAARVTANFLDVLGVAPLHGRSFLSTEDRRGGEPVAMISASLWQRLSGIDRAFMDRMIVLDSVGYRIVGVLPPEFEFPYAGIDVWLTRPSEWSGVPPSAWDRTASLTGFARLKLGVGTEQVVAELNVLNEQYVGSHSELPDANPDAVLIAESLSRARAADVRDTLWMLFGAVGFVFLICCANVASLALVRASSRSREFAIRAAMGASGRRLFVQLLTENLFLALVGGVLGLGGAAVFIDTVKHSTAIDLHGFQRVGLDGAAVGLTLILVVLTGLVFGIAPALQWSNSALLGPLREQGTSGRTGTRRWLTSRGLLVVGQVALSTVLVVGAALLIKSAAQLSKVDPGFQPERLVTAQISLSPARYDSGPPIVNFFDQLVQRVEGLPGIHSATVAASLPTTPYQLVALQAAELPTVPFAERPLGQLQTVGAGYFRTLGISLRRGRLFSERDLHGKSLVAIVNETLVRHFWPDYPAGPVPVGQHVTLGAGSASVEIVGICADVHEAGLAAEIVPEVYLPARLSPPRTAYLVARTNGDPLQFVGAIRSQVAALDHDQTIRKISTMDALIDSSLRKRHLTLALLSAFAAVALLLAAVGIYGVVSFAASRRTREIGVRRALGARQADILWLFVARGLVLALLGLAAGLYGAVVLARTMEGLLFEVNAASPTILLAIALLFVTVAVAASYLPARRAARVDPIAALR